MKQIITVITLVLPTFALAAGLQDLTNAIGRAIYALIPITFALAILLFFFGLAKFIYSSGDTGANQRGKDLMIWGVIAIFVMSSIWGLVAFLQSTFGVSNSQAPNQPTIEIRGS